MLSVIVAVSENGVIGRDGDLPWRLSADLKRFRELTMGHHIVMGRATYESIGKPLPKRTSVVLSRDANYTVAEYPEIHTATSLDAALEIASGDDEVFVIGGEAIFREALPRADRLYLTLVHADVEGDVHFPADGLSGWELSDSQRFEADGKNEHDYSFRVYRPGGAG